MTPDVFVERFVAALGARGLRPTPRRLQVARHVARRGGHATVQQLVDELQAVDPAMGSVTVYRAVRQLEAAGLLQRTSLDGVDHYELPSTHHDHLVCEGCGAVAEFYSAELEARQVEVARRLGFRVTAHAHVVRGRCVRCRG